MAVYKLGGKEMESEGVKYNCKRCNCDYWLTQYELFHALTLKKAKLTCPEGHILVYPKRIK